MLETNNTENNLEHLKQESYEIKNSFPDAANKTQDELIFYLIDKGVDIFQMHLQEKLELEKYETDKHYETESQRLKFADKINKRENWHKTILILVTIGCMSLLAAFKMLTETTNIIFAIIIAAILKDNIKDIINNIYKRPTDNKNN